MDFCVYHFHKKQIKEDNLFESLQKHREYDTRQTCMFMMHSRILLTFALYVLAIQQSVLRVQTSEQHF